MVPKQATCSQTISLQSGGRTLYRLDSSDASGVGGLLIADWRGNRAFLYVGTSSDLACWHDATSVGCSAIVQRPTLPGIGVIVHEYQGRIDLKGAGWATIPPDTDSASQQNDLAPEQTFRWTGDLPDEWAPLVPLHAVLRGMYDVLHREASGQSP